MHNNTEKDEHGHGERDSIQSDYYGVVPGIAGILFGLALIAFMFALADGFA